MLVVSGLVLNFVPEPAAAAAELARVATPGGVVAADVWTDVDGMKMISQSLRQGSDGPGANRIALPRRAVEPATSAPPPRTPAAGSTGAAAGRYGRPPAARSRSISLPIPEAARPHGGNRRGEAAAATVAGGVRAVLGNEWRTADVVNVDARTSAMLWIWSLDSRAMGGDPIRRAAGPSTRKPCCALASPTCSRVSTLAVPRSTIAPLASARSVLIGAADRPDPIKATKRRAPERSSGDRGVAPFIQAVPAPVE